MAERVSIIAKEELLTWLEGKPRDWAIVIAARAALRVVPGWQVFLNSRAFKKQASSESLVLALFRCSLVSYSSVVEHRQDLRAARAAHNAARATVAAHAAVNAAPVFADIAAHAVRAADAAARATVAAHAAAVAADATVRAADATALAAVVAVYTGTAAYAAARAAFWRAISDDLNALSDGTGPVELAKLPLSAIRVDWAALAPDDGKLRALPAEALFEPEWQRFSHALLERGSNWQLWVDWWEAARDGRAPWGLPRDVANEVMIEALTWPDQKWDRPAAEVNAEIQALIDAARERVTGEEEEPPPLDALPAQEPGALEFGGAEDEPITLASPPPASDKLRDTPERRDDYAELRGKAEQLIEEGPNRCGHLERPLRRLLELPADLSQTRAYPLWSRMNTLRIKWSGHLAALEFEKQFKEKDERKLEPIIADLLGDLVETWNAFVIGDPNLIDRDAARPGPQDQEVARDQAKLIEPMIAEATSDRQITDVHAGEALKDELTAATASGDSLAERQGAERGARSLRNMVAELLSRAYRPVRSALDSAKGEGGVVWKGVREGAYRAIGASIVSDIAGITTIYAPFFRFVARHAETLKAYAVAAFNNPKVITIIEWIVKFVAG